MRGKCQSCSSVKKTVYYVCSSRLDFVLASQKEKSVNYVWILGTYNYCLDIVMFYFKLFIKIWLIYIFYQYFSENANKMNTFYK